MYHWDAREYRASSSNQKKWALELLSRLELIPRVRAHARVKPPEADGSIRFTMVRLEVDARRGA